MTGAPDRCVTVTRGDLASSMGPMSLQGRDRGSHCCTSYVLKAQVMWPEQIGVCHLSQYAGTVRVGEGMCARACVRE